MSGSCRPAAELLRTEPDELLAAIGRLAERQREAEKELAGCASSRARPRPRHWPQAAAADGGVVVARRDKVDADALRRRWPRPILRHDGVRAVVLGGSPDGTKVAIVAATGGDARRHPARAHARATGRRRGRRVGRGGHGGGQGPLADRGGAGRGAAAPLRVSGEEASGRGPGRVAALDLGARRIGVAYSDSGRTLASPWGTIERSGDPARDRRPWSTPCARSRRRPSWSGCPSASRARSARRRRSALDEAAALRALLEPLGVTVETADERFTTVEAERSLRAAGRTGKAARKVVDSAAAMVLLQAWLDNA